MRKIISVVLCLLLAASLAIFAFADGSVSFSVSPSVSTLERGGTVTLSVNCSSSAEATTYGMKFSYDTDVFELVDGNIDISADTLVSSFQNGFAFMFQDATAYSGSVGTVTLKIKDDAPLGTYTISGAPSVKNGTDSVSVSSGSVTITVFCEHSYGEWLQTAAPSCTQDGQQERTCTKCATVESQTIPATGHQMDGWTQIKAPSCTEEGEESGTCTVEGCGQQETRPVAATGHQMNHWIQVEAPTCTDAGEESCTCSADGCDYSETRTVSAKGHSFSGWETTIASTCIAEGEQERKCSVCDLTETQKTELAPHSFQDPEIIKEATLTATGLLQGKCLHCSETTEQVIPCTASDAATGIVVETEEGVFSDGTSINFSSVEITAQNQAILQEAMAEISGYFEVYFVGFVNQGETVMPNGQYTLTLPASARIAKENLAVCFINDEGVVTQIEYSHNEDGNIRVVSDQIGLFVLADKSVPYTSEPEATEPDETSTEPERETAPPYYSSADDNMDDMPPEEDHIGLLIVLLILIVIGILSYISYRRR